MSRKDSGILVATLRIQASQATISIQSWQDYRRARKNLETLETLPHHVSSPHSHLAALPDKSFGPDQTMWAQVASSWNISGLVETSIASPLGWKLVATTPTMCPRPPFEKIRPPLVRANTARISQLPNPQHGDIHNRKRPFGSEGASSLVYEHALQDIWR